MGKKKQAHRPLNRVAEDVRIEWGAQKLRIQLYMDTEDWIVEAYPTPQRAQELVRANPPASARTEDDLRALAIEIAYQPHARGSGWTIKRALMSLRPYRVQIPSKIPVTSKEMVNGLFEHGEEFGAARTW
jgi:hypothetical protein